MGDIHQLTSCTRKITRYTSSTSTQTGISDTVARRLAGTVHTELLAGRASRSQSSWAERVIGYAQQWAGHIVGGMKFTGITIFILIVNCKEEDENTITSNELWMGSIIAVPGSWLVYHRFDGLQPLFYVAGSSWAAIGWFGFGLRDYFTYSFQKLARRTSQSGKGRKPIRRLSSNAFSLGMRINWREILIYSKGGKR